MSDSRREVDQLVRDLRHQGFMVTRTGSGHWKIRAAGGGPFVIMAFSPRSARFHKTITRLREIGYEPGL